MSSNRGWMKKAGLVLAMTLILTPGLAAGPGNSGFYLGAGLGGAIPNHDEDSPALMMDAETGAGLEVHLGYNFTDNLGFGVQAGGAFGEAVEDWGWLQSYAVLSGRFSLPLTEKFVPYVEIGLGPYVLWYLEGDSTGPTDSIIADPVLGFRFALGTSFYFRRFYIGPEISYHVARYTDWSYKPEDGGSFDFESDETGDKLLILLRLGYHFRH